MSQINNISNYRNQFLCLRFDQDAELKFINLFWWLNLCYKNGTLWTLWSLVFDRFVK